MSKRNFIEIAILTLSAALSGCGGTSGDSTPPSAVASTATGKAVMTVGTVTEVVGTKVTVGDIVFEASSATVLKDGNAATVAQLKVGEVVTVSGRVSDDKNTGTAARIEFDDDVEGPISAIDAAAGTVTVLRQRVRVDATTLFDDSIAAGLSSLAVGQSIEVSGFRDAAGEIVASRIELRGASVRQLEVTGVASAVNSVARKLKIGTLTVDYSGATLRDFPAGGPQNGDRIEAKGSTINARGELVAASLERKPAMAADATVQVELEGLVTRLVSATEFEINGRRVRLAPGAVIEFEGDVRVDLAENVKVEVEGTLNADGILVAVKLKLKAASGARIAARVDSVDLTARTLKMLGVEIRVPRGARMRDQSDARLTNFAMENLAAGDYVEIRGIELPTAATQAGPGRERLFALLLERQRPSDEVRVRGRASNVARPELRVLGVRVVTQASTQFAGVSADDFFAQAQGRVVSVKGSASGSIVTAREVAFE